MAKNKEELIRFANNETFEKGNLDIVEEIFATDYIVHAGCKDYKKPAFVRKFAKMLRSSIPNLRVVEIEFLNKAGNTIVWQRTLSGTHKTKTKGIPPTGKRVKWRDMEVTRFENKKIAEEWTVSELAGQLLLNIPR